MILARVVGTIVATRKDPRLEGFKLLIVKPVAPDGKDESGYVIAVDTVSAGSNETVIVVSGNLSCARLSQEAARADGTIGATNAAASMSAAGEKGSERRMAGPPRLAAMLSQGRNAAVHSSTGLGDRGGVFRHLPQLNRR